MSMLFGVNSYFRVEIEELIDLKMEYVNDVYVSQHENWAWDSASWNVYADEEYGPEVLTFLDGDRTVILDKEDGAFFNFIFSSKPLEYKDNEKF